MSNVVNSYVVSKTLWKEDFVVSNVCWQTSSPEYNLREVIPVLLSPELLERCHNNCLIAEVWERKPVAQCDTLLGVARLPCNSLFVAFQNPALMEQLMQAKFPVVALNGWIDVVNPLNTLQTGKLHAVLCLGTEHQIRLFEAVCGPNTQSHLKSSRGDVDGLSFKGPGNKEQLSGKQVHFNVCQQNHVEVNELNQKKVNTITKPTEALIRQNIQQDAAENRSNSPSELSLNAAISCNSSQEDSSLNAEGTSPCQQSNLCDGDDNVGVRDQECQTDTFVLDFRDYDPAFLAKNPKKIDPLIIKLSSNGLEIIEIPDSENPSSVIKARSDENTDSCFKQQDGDEASYAFNIISNKEYDSLSGCDDPVADNGDSKKKSAEGDDLAANEITEDCHLADADQTSIHEDQTEEDYFGNESESVHITGGKNLVKPEHEHVKPQENGQQSTLETMNAPQSCSVPRGVMGKAMFSNASSGLTEHQHCERRIWPVETALPDKGDVDLDFTTSVFAQALSQKLSELDEITRRLKRRLLSVTLEVASPSHLVDKQDEVMFLFCEKNDNAAVQKCARMQLEAKEDGSSTAKHCRTESSTSHSNNDDRMDPSESQCEEEPEKEFLENGATEKDVSSDNCMQDFNTLTDYIMETATKELEIANVFNPLLFQQFLLTNMNLIQRRCQDVHSSSDNQIGSETLATSSTTEEPDNGNCSAEGGHNSCPCEKEKTSHNVAHLSKCRTLGECAFQGNMRDSNVVQLGLLSGADTIKTDRVSNPNQTQERHSECELKDENIESGKEEIESPSGSSTSSDQVQKAVNRNAGILPHSRRKRVCRLAPLFLQKLSAMPAE